MLSSLDIVLSSLGMIIMLSSQTDPVDCVMLSITYHHWEWYVIITDPVHHSLTDQASPIPHQPSILTYPSRNPHFPTLNPDFPSPNPHLSLTQPSILTQPSLIPHISLIQPSPILHDLLIVLSSLAYRSIITGEVGETYVPSVLHALRVHSSKISVEVALTAQPTFAQKYAIFLQDPGS